MSVNAATGQAQAARHSFRAARRSLAAAVLAGERAGTVAAAWEVLHTGDQLRAVLEHPSGRDQRSAVRWRRWALQALRRDPPDIGLLRRAMRLNHDETK